MKKKNCYNIATSLVLDRIVPLQSHLQKKQRRIWRPQQTVGVTSSSSPPVLEMWSDSAASSCKSVQVIDVEQINLHGGWTVKLPPAQLICRVSLLLTPSPWACYYIFLLSGNGFISLLLSPAPSLPPLQIVFSLPPLRSRHVPLSPSRRRWGCQRW